MIPTLSIPLAFFTNPLMLGWLAVAAAPLIIHLWNKRKYREVSWAAIDFLLAAMRKNSRRIQLEQWILLAVRTLLLILLVLAVAQPFLEQAGLKFVAGQKTHKVLVIDGSFSMAYKPTDKSRFDRAKELAAQIVDESSQGDGFTLVLMSQPPRVVVGTPAMERGDFVQEIENLRLPHTGLDLPATLEQVEEILKRAQRDYPRLVQSEVYFLSDLGRAGWTPELGGAKGMEEFRARSKRISETARLVVIDLGQAGSENLAVTEVATAEPYVTVGRDVTVTAEVGNFGRQSRSQQLVEFFVDGRRAGEEYVDVQAGSQAAVAFNYQFEAPGDHSVEVRLASDLLDIDNHRWLSIPVEESLRVLVVDGRPGGGDFSGSADYLAVALSPRGNHQERELVQADVVGERELLERDLNQYDCVFLTNVQQFTNSEAQVLHKYLEQGGGLVFFLGEQVRAESYNEQLFAPSKPELRVLPAGLETAVTESQYRFQPGDYRHPIIRAFRGQDRAGLLTTPVYKYFRLELPEPTAAEVALAFENGDPVIVEERIGRGRSILVATSADTTWTTMPMWPSYVPIVQELLAAAVGGKLQERNIEVGQPLASSVRTLASDVQLTVRPPAGEARPSKLESEGDYARWSFGDTDQSGLYVAQFSAPVSRNDTFAANVDTRESDLTKLDAAELRGEDLWPGINFDYETNWQDLDEGPSGEISRRAGLHRWLLVGVLGLLLAETVMAWRFGRRTA
jgi:hypothetical protein